MRFLRRAPADLPGPCVIGATGGSGTRVVARIARAGGLFIGRDLNASDDAVAFGAYSDRWINEYVAPGTNPVPAPLARAMAEDLERTVTRHRLKTNRDAVAWGWKEPRSIYLLPFLLEHLPSLRFLHVIRDGRDMAFSDNQNQLRKHGVALLTPEELRLAIPLQSITLWSRINMRAATWGEAVLGPRYLRLRFEDLCADARPTIESICDFFGLRRDGVTAAEREVVPPPSIGRWRDAEAAMLRELEERGGAALARFGYPGSN